jgi:hypothetical protein
MRRCLTHKLNKMTGTAWGESGEGREAEFEVSLTEARRTRRGEKGGLGACLISCVNGFSNGCNLLLYKELLTLTEAGCAAFETGS